MTDLIAELKALKEKATPGPVCADPHRPVLRCKGDPYSWLATFDNVSDCKLFAALVNHLPTILAKLEEGGRMREALESVKADMLPAKQTNELSSTGKRIFSTVVAVLAALESTHDHT